MKLLRNSSHRRLHLSLIAATLLLAFACGGSATDGSSGAGLLATAARNPDESLSILLMARDLDVRDSRLPIVVLLSDEHMTRLDDRLSELSFSYRHTDDGQFTPLPGMVWREWPVRGGAYVGKPAFGRPGIWEVRVTFESEGQSRIGSSFVDVKQESSAPGAGERAPVTVTKTARTVDEVRQISSALDPDPGFYSISLDEALKNGRPTVVLFSTPAFCSTQTCGPQLETLGELKAEHEGEIDFIHVEIFDNIREMLDSGNSSIGKVAEPVDDWGLITEPWTFFIDSNGVISARFEQFTTLAELSDAAETLLSQD